MCLPLVPVFNFLHAGHRRVDAAELLLFFFSQVLLSANPLARQSKPITVRGQTVNLHNIHFPASLSGLACHPWRREICGRGPRRPGRPALNWLNSLSRDPCTSPGFTRRRHTRSKTAAAHSLMGGPGRCPRKIKGGKTRGKVYEAAFASLNEKLLHRLLKDRLQLAELAAPSCLQASPGPQLPRTKEERNKTHTHNTAAAQGDDSVTCPPQCSLFEPQTLSVWHKRPD